LTWHTKAIAVTFATLVSGTALADASSAAHNLFANMNRSGMSFHNLNESDILVSPTLVKGIYALTNRQGGFVTFTNEAGTLTGDSRRFEVMSSNGTGRRPLTPDEVKALRAEVMAAIDYDKLPKVTYGNGGGRRLVMFSAIDCGYCKRFEDEMRKQARGLDSTIYVVPSSLQPISQGGLQQWQTVSRLWCAEDAGTAWRAFWTSGAIPQPRQCTFGDPQTALRTRYNLSDILSGVGVGIHGTPSVVREDGLVINNKTDMTTAYIVSTFGSASAPSPGNPTPNWLASVDSGFQAQAVNGQPVAPQGTQPAQRNGKVNLKEVLNLNKLFGK